MQEGENPFGPQPNLDAAPVVDQATPAADQAAPVVDAAAPQPVVGAPAAAPQPVVGGAPVAAGTGAGMSKGLIIGIVGAVVAVIVVVLGVILVPALFAPDYEDAKEKVEALDAALDVVLYDECSDVYFDYDDDGVSETKFNETLAKCNKGFSDLETNMQNLEKSTGVKNDEEIKDLFGKFKTAYEAFIPKLKPQIEIYSSLRGFSTKYGDIYYSYDDEIEFTDAEVDAMTASMTASSNAVLKEYGPKFNTALKEYIKAYNAKEAAYDQYWDDEITSTEYYEIRDAYYDADDALDELYDDFSTDLEEVLDLDLDDEKEDLVESLNSLKSKIRTKYFESQS